MVAPTVAPPDESHGVGATTKASSAAVHDRGANAGDVAQLVGVAGGAAYDASGFFALDRVVLINGVLHRPSSGIPETIHKRVMGSQLGFRVSAMGGRGHRGRGGGGVSD